MTVLSIIDSPAIDCLLDCHEPVIPQEVRLLAVAGQACWVLVRVKFTLPMLNAWYNLFAVELIPSTKH